MTQPSDSGPELDAGARLLLRAFQDEESLPADVSARVLQRLQDSGALGATPPLAVAPAEPNTTVVRGRWWIPAAAIACAAAAAVLLWQGDMFSATQDPQRAPVQARDQAQTAEAPFEAPSGAPRRASSGQRERSASPPTGSSATGAQPNAGPSPAAPQAGDLEPQPHAGATSPTANRRGSALRKAGAARPRPEKAGDPPAPAPAETASSLAAETRALAKAQAAVAAGRYDAALATIAASDKRFPGGVLKEERAALRAVALCESGSPKAERAAADFAKAHPASALRARVQNACAND